MEFLGVMVLQYILVHVKVYALSVRIAECKVVKSVCSARDSG